VPGLFRAEADSLDPRGDVVASLFFFFFFPPRSTRRTELLVVVLFSSGSSASQSLRRSPFSPVALIRRLFFPSLSVVDQLGARHQIVVLLAFPFFMPLPLTIQRRRKARTLVTFPSPPPCRLAENSFFVMKKVGMVDFYEKQILFFPSFFPLLFLPTV